MWMSLLPILRAQMFWHLHPTLLLLLATVGGVALETKFVLLLRLGAVRRHCATAAAGEKALETTNRSTTAVGLTTILRMSLAIFLLLSLAYCHTPPFLSFSR